MKLTDYIKANASKNKTKIQSSFTTEIDCLFNSLFFLPKNAEEELKFINQMIQGRGTGDHDRIGLHASSIISSEKDYCPRMMVLSLLYKALQGEEVNANLKRIFEEGNAIHEKWQRLFIRGNLGKATDMDFTRYNKKYQLQFTPDAILNINNEQYVVEIKSVNTYSYQRQNEHPSAKKQIQFYMFLTGIHKGIVLQEDKNTQDFKLNIYEYDEASILEFVERLEAIQEFKYNLINEKKVPPKHCACSSYSDKKVQSCSMRDVCFKKGKPTKLKGW